MIKIREVKKDGESQEGRLERGKEKGGVKRRGEKEGERGSQVTLRWMLIACWSPQIALFIAPKRGEAFQYPYWLCNNGISRCNKAFIAKKGKQLSDCCFFTSSRPCVTLFICLCINLALFCFFSLSRHWLHCGDARRCFGFWARLEPLLV